MIRKIDLSEILRNASRSPAAEAEDILLRVHHVFTGTLRDAQLTLAGHFMTVACEDGNCPHCPSN